MAVQKSPVTSTYNLRRAPRAQTPPASAPASASALAPASPAASPPPTPSKSKTTKSSPKPKPKAKTNDPELQSKVIEARRTAYRPRGKGSDLSPFPETTVDGKNPPRIIITPPPDEIVFNSLDLMWHAILYVEGKERLEQTSALGLLADVAGWHRQVMRGSCAV
ncbi:hypothetical protein L198_08223 [Cryptococcus wingfieldii CBS 7118]|uniref:Uncharacterized protein n=1 Tax=Cryptococcus wingfieldii CBS 7118 TaxID=1295528 RepID=A0A1E3HD70_9TREE|nr:hypothetical protein L198_08223 [Cryptococcus wingfieldii CBS 7118]ODN74293.1 hypothetical protein L198_08223 [Cryptococcus wingfieldii CBS 7118]